MNHVSSPIYFICVCLCLCKPKKSNDRGKFKYIAKFCEKEMKYLNHI